MAFLYDARGHEFPPMRPPDGGNSDNQVPDPDIDLDRPLVTTVPGCTYYRENCLSGEHLLFVALYMEERWPPIPSEGDYWWGKKAASIAFPFAGDQHQQSVTEMDMTLTPVTRTACPADKPNLCPDGSCVALPEECCPAETPHKCADGRCVALPEECSTGGEGSPDDGQVSSCRYRSLFIEDNCADFPISKGWTSPLVDSFCKAQQGADPATVVVVQGRSCLVEKGSLQGVTRCLADDAGRAWYAYNAPWFVCGSFLGGAFQNGPFCDPY